jgi:MinD-like ATPase involved in chromosome partitioning or flagellar assembly/ActR/RegA family two-component response regulator
MEDVPRISILMIDSDPADVGLAKEIFGALPDEYSMETVGELAAGLKRLNAGGIDVVLLDLTLPDSGGFDTFEKIAQEGAGIPIIVFSNLDDAGLALRAVRAGAQDYVVKGRISPASLVRCVKYAVERHHHIAALLRRDRGKKGAKVVTFLGVKGGVGTTTLVLNTAAALASTGRKTITLELAPYSSFSVQLGKPRALDLAELLHAKPADINPRVIEQHIVDLPFGFRALYAAPSALTPMPIPPEHADAIIAAAAGCADFVVVDLPSQVASAHQAAVLASDYSVLVLEPDPLCTAFGKSSAEMLRQWGLDSTAFGCAVINRMPLENSLRPQEIQRNMECGLVTIVPGAAEGCSIAFQASRPLVSLQPESRFAATMRELAEALAQSPVKTLDI